MIERGTLPETCSCDHRCKFLRKALGDAMGSGLETVISGQFEHKLNRSQNYKINVKKGETPGNVALGCMGNVRAVPWLIIVCNCQTPTVLGSLVMFLPLTESRVFL